MAGLIGTLLGIGGGSLTTPLLILCGVNPHQAIAASLVAITGTSLGGILHLFQHKLVHVRIAFFLETASVLGAVLGALLAIQLPAKTVSLVVASVLVFSAMLFILLPVETHRRPVLGATVSHALAWTLSLIAGFLSATAGIGGGIIKTPILTLILGFNIKAAIATSKLMVGITAVTGALVYGLVGYVNPVIVVPLTIGTYLGASIGARVLIRLKAWYTKTIAVAAYTTLAITLLLKYWT